MRSCEYSKVPNTKNKRTKLFCVRNFHSFKQNKEIYLQSKFLQQTDYVAITFEFQKNDSGNETVTQQRTEDETLCPVSSWETLLKSYFHLFFDSLAYINGLF